MQMKTGWSFVALAALTLAGPVAAQDMSRFKDGPVITGFGKTVPIESDLPIPQKTVFKVMLDGSAGAKPGEPNRTLDSAARFLNMHVAAGVPERNVRIVVIIHGQASLDLTSDGFYGARREGAKNANAELIRQLVAHGVEIYLCGQSAAAFGIAKTDLVPGVKVSLSAMTARALFEQRGYALVQ
jgi:intracellular sulfur oxidation DsrE/DsrF family protein